MSQLIILSMTIEFISMPSLRFGVGKMKNMNDFSLELSNEPMVNL